MLKKFLRNGTFIFITILAMSLLCGFLFGTETIDTRADAAVSPFEGNGTEENPYLLSSAQNLCDLSQLVNDGERDGSGKLFATRYYQLTNNIDMSGKTWTPIGIGSGTYTYYEDITSVVLSKYNSDIGGKDIFNGIWSQLYIYLTTDTVGTSATSTYSDTQTYYYRYTVKNYFYGTLDGNGYSVQNLSYSTTVGTTDKDTNVYGGLFGYLCNATVSDLHLENFSLSMTGSKSIVGGVTGGMYHSSVTDCSVTASAKKEIYATKHAGGIVGQLNQETFAPLSAQYQNEKFSYDGFSSFLQSEGLTNITTNTVSGCTAIGDNLTVSSGESNSTSGYAGGIVGYSKDESTPKISNCFNSASVLHKGIVKQAAGILGGASKTIYVHSCIGVKSFSQNDTLYYGAVIPVPENNYIVTLACFYDNEISGDAFCTGKTISELLSSAFISSQVALSTSWTVPTSVGNIYYYPLPSSNANVKSSFTAQKITVDGVTKEIHHTGVPFTYTFETAPKKTGYTFSQWNDGTNLYNAGVEHQYTLSADLGILSQWTLIKPSLILQNKYSFVYNGSEQSFSVRYMHVLQDLQATYQWYLFNESTENYDAIGSATTDTLTIKNVSQSGKYQVTVTLSDGILSSYDSATTTIVVTKKAVECTVSVEKTAKTYDGEYPANGKNLTLPTYSLSSALCTFHIETVTYRYATQKYTTQEEMNNGTFIPVTDIVGVGIYYIYPSVQIMYDSEDVTDNYSITQKNTNLTYSISNALITMDTWSEKVFDYDGSVHKINKNDFSGKVHTVQNTAYSVLFGYQADNCLLTEMNFSTVQESTVYYIITAPNHTARAGSLQVTVRPVSVTLQTKANSAKPTKTYDATNSFSTFFFTSAFYDISYPVGYEGERTTVSPVSATFAQINAGQNIDVTVVFSLADDENFEFSGNDYLVYSNGIINKAVVSPVFTQNFSYSKTYDGTSAVSIGNIPSSAYYAQASFGTVPVTLSSAHLDSANAGERVCSYVFRLSDITNYTFTNGTDETEIELSATVLPSPITVTPLNVIQKTYDKTRNGTTESVTVSDYELTFQGGLMTTVTVSSVQFATVWVGDTTATVVFATENENFTIDPCIFNAHINPAEVTLIEGTATPINRSYDGTNIVHFTGEQFTGVAMGDTLSVTSANIGNVVASQTPYTVQNSTITLSSDNYVFASVPTEVFQVTVSPADSTVHPWYEEVTVYLSDTALPTLFLTEGDTPGTVEWDDPSVLFEGSQDFSWTFTPTDNINYLPCSGQINIQVIRIQYIQLWVSHLPSKIDYKPFETFSPTGMEISAEKNILSDGTPKTSPDQTGVIEIISFDECSVLYENALSYFLFGDTKITLCFDELSYDQTVIVTKIQLPDVTVSGINEYNGSTQNVTLLHYNASLMTCTGDSGLLAKDYTATVALNDANNYAWESGSSSPLLLDWTINPKGQGKIVLDSYQFTYTGQAVSVHFLNDPNELPSCHLVEGSSTVSATNVGEYSITIELTNENYYWLSDNQYDTSDTEPQVITWNILPLKIKKPVLHNLPYTYNGAWQEIETDSESHYTLSGDTVAKEVGNYSITASLKNNNFAWADGTTENVVLPYSILPLYVAEPDLSDVSYTYSGSRYSIIIPSNSFYTVEGTLSQTKVGTYSYYLALIDPVNTKWTTSATPTISKTWTISPVRVKMPTASRSNTFSGYEQTAIIPLSSFYTLSGNTQTNVGEYIAKATLNDKTNYVWEENSKSNDIDIPWSIEKCKVNRPTAPENVLYTGLKQTVVIESNPAYTVTGNSAKNVGEYTAVVALNDEENYIWDDETHAPLSFTWSICSLTFVSNGETTANTTYVLGNSLSTPVLSGYTFKGWYTTADFKEDSVVTSLDSLNGNTTIYAKWEKDANAITTSDTSTSSSSGDGTGISSGVIIGIAVFGACLLLAVGIFVVGKGGLMGKKH